MWIINLPSLHRNIEDSAIVESKYDTVKQGFQCANYSLSLFHLLSFTPNKKCELLKLTGEQ